MNTARIGGTKTTNDILTITVHDPALSGGTEAVSYTVLAGDTLSSIALGLATAINSDTNLQALGVIANAHGTNTFGNIRSASHNQTTYTESTSGGATETITFGIFKNGLENVTVGGTKTTGNTLTVTTHNQALTSGSEAVTYTVLSTDTLLTISNGLAAAINADTKLQTLGVSSPTNAATLATTQSFSGNALLPAGDSGASASAIDGGSNSKTSGYQLSVTSGGASTLTYDLNGNMTGDGTNSYSWDAENRMIQITYPGSGNNSQFVYDGMGRNVSIVETVSGTITSTKLLVWAQDKMRSYQPCEARNAFSVVTAQYFPLGETISGTSYFYTTDHLGLSAASVVPFMQLSLIGGHPRGFNPLAHSGSIREMTNSSGAIQQQLAYDPYGRPIVVQGSLSPDFQYSGYYEHAASGLAFTLNRAYSPNLARWISRDKIEETQGTNLYEYAMGNPISLSDPTGTQAAPGLGNAAAAAAGAAAGANGVFSGPAGGLYFFGTQGQFSVFPDPNADNIIDCLLSCERRWYAFALSGRYSMPILKCALANCKARCIELFGGDFGGGGGGRVAA